MRVHTGGLAERDARDPNAHAFAIGEDLWFGAGAWAPGTERGDALLVHELTHVVDQYYNFQHTVTNSSGNPSRLVDEYVDPSVVNRATPTAPGVHNDQGLMSNFWTRDGAGNTVPHPNTHLPPRNLDENGADIRTHAPTTTPTTSATPPGRRRGSPSARRISETSSCTIAAWDETAAGCRRGASTAGTSRTGYG